MAKSATIDHRSWTSTVHDDNTPWGDAHDSIEIAACETALERMLSRIVMQAESRPSIRTVDQGDDLMRLGDPASTMMLVLDGIVEISIDDRVLAESGPVSVTRPPPVCSRATALARSSASPVIGTSVPSSSLLEATA
ncbi:MAG: hypothetical protein AAGK32_08055, partial [Actinomycetota bacterium]